MKLVVQIPCLNEAESLAKTIADIPRSIEGVSEVIIVLLDDGSTDTSRSIAQECGADLIISHGRNRGLADTFRTGLKTALELDADLIVNFDGDGQYRGDEIAALIAPILLGNADIVIGNRQVHKMESYTPRKRMIHKLGTSVINRLGNITISDPVSGFRALNREAALLLNIYSTFSYTTEMLIQAGHARLRIREIPVHTNPTPRPSRLFRSVRHFVTRTAMTILRSYAMYKPLKVFSTIALLLFVIGALPVLRFLLFYLAGDGDGHVQSLVLGGTFLMLSCVAFFFAILADVQASNRVLLEQVMEEVQQLKINASKK